jgi:GntR family transcriptional regulator
MSSPQVIFRDDVESFASELSAARGAPAVTAALDILYMSIIYSQTVTAPAPRLLLPPISPAAAGALYQQIVDGIKQEISEGRLAPGAPLPSFRGLAEDLLVSVITVKRAYEELERDGIIFRRQGLGTFVAHAADQRSRDARKQRAIGLLQDALREAVDAELSEHEVLQIVRTRLPKRRRA